MNTRTIFQVPFAKLMALGKHISPANDIRYYLNSVAVDPAGVLVSTNGRMMAGFKFETPKATDPNPNPILIPCATLKLLEQKFKENAPKSGSSYAYSRLARNIDITEIRTTGTDDMTTVELKIDGLGESFTTKGCDGTFPAWRKVLPEHDRHSGLAAQFDPEYPMAFAECLRDALCKKKEQKVLYVIHHDGDRSASVECADSPEFFGVLMPWYVGKSAPIRLTDSAVETNRVLAGIDKACTNLHSLEHSLEELRKKHTGEFNIRYAQDLRRDLKTSLLKLSSEAVQALVDKSQKAA
jgi:hypothetical protein